MRLLVPILAFLAFAATCHATMNLGTLWFAQNDGQYFPLGQTRSHTPKKLGHYTTFKDGSESTSGRLVQPWWENYYRWSRAIRLRKCKFLKYSVPKWLNISGSSNAGFCSQKTSPHKKWYSFFREHVISKAFSPLWLQKSSKNHHGRLWKYNYQPTNFVSIFEKWFLFNFECHHRLRVQIWIKPTLNFCFQFILHILRGLYSPFTIWIT